MNFGCCFMLRYVPIRIRRVRLLLVPIGFRCLLVRLVCLICLVVLKTGPDVGMILNSGRFRLETYVYWVCEVVCVDSVLELVVLRIDDDLGVLGFDEFLAFCCFYSVGF
ncbi:hypothetical protein MtrunA17_Chr1g0172021 [Medicago truncatula]|uniref:Transmembrane protein n=1 Tax=Medicago truncatula TaxID=3880 RepID=A0A396JL70_MEDTR|nr:hypothetical protein MtrunA17_Chr1g0172021 [Medicago truncatula]